MLRPLCNKHRLFTSSVQLARGASTAARTARSFAGARRATSAIALVRPSLPSPIFSNAIGSVRMLSTNAETLEFQAETRKLLDIVTNSIYTDKEVFIRELISNASDALEKYRYNANKGAVLPDSLNVSPAISIEADAKAGTLVISDTGIGMTRQDLVSNLGTIARSGSKAFVEETKASGDANGIIGQFGVGFYASFMVADQVVVESQSALAPSTSSPGDAPAGAHRWSSDGFGTFHIEEIPSTGQSHGTKITLRLKETCKEFADAERLKAIIRRYSTFISFPITVNGQAVNTVQAIWTESPTAVTEEQYRDFFQFLSRPGDSFRYKLHYRTDAPLDLKCLFFVPTSHEEKYGMGRMEPGVNLYSRKVLIEARPKDLLPDWLRFLRGVVDSEDLPLSLSREKPQDSALLRRIRDVLVRKLLRTFADEQRRDAEAYRAFYGEYHMFLKEGVCSDHKYADLLSKLLLFESSSRAAGEQISLDDYLAATPPTQKHVYYLLAPSRDAALGSPYLEFFRKRGVDVLLLYNAIDEFVMANLGEYSGRKLLSVESSAAVEAAGEAKDTDTDAKDADGKDKDAATETGQGARLSDTEATDLCAYLRTVLGTRVREVRVTTRLSDSPAIVTDHESGALRRMMRMVEQANAGGSPGAAAAQLAPQLLEVNPAHPLVVELYRARDQPDTEEVAQQLFDNALLAAGLLDDPRYMLPRLQTLLLRSLRK